MLSHVLNAQMKVAGLVLLMTGAWVMAFALSIPSSSAADVQAFQRAIEVSIHHRGDPEEPPLTIGGILTITVDPHSGSFTGTITPGLGFQSDTPTGTEGEPRSSVLFRFIDDSLVADPDVIQIAVDGQINGRAVNMVLRDVLGEGRHIFASGTTEEKPGKRFDRDFGRIAGPAVGPNPKDDGDWITSFFPPPPSPSQPCPTPVVRNAYYSGGVIHMDAAASCIKDGATARLVNPLSSASCGNFPVRFDYSGAFLQTTDVRTCFPPQTCRTVFVRNPDGAESAGVSVCR